MGVSAEHGCYEEVIRILEYMRLGGYLSQCFQDGGKLPRTSNAMISPCAVVCLSTAMIQPSGSLTFVVERLYT